MDVKPKPLFRFSKALINFLIIILFAFAFDGLCTSKIASKTSTYQQCYNGYYSLKTEYNALEDKYGLYYYDESGKRIKNDKADTTPFYNDPRVKEIVVTAKGYQSTLKKIDLITFSISYVFSVLIITLIPPIFSKKNYDFGGRVFSIVISRRNWYVNKKEYYQIAFLYILFHYILGIATLMIFNLCDFISIFIKKNQGRSLMERMFKYDVTIDFEKTESEILTEEKEFENKHSHKDETPRDIFKLK